ncbi:MAG: M48 family metalloprotease [Phycisphaerae bacterium]|nr:M48 family metalloprotease [Phycisphaerae bacterium]
MVRVIVALISMLMLATGCQTGAGGPRSWSPGLSGRAEALLGQRAAVTLEERLGGTIPDAIALDRMHAVGSRLAEATPELAIEWHFHMLASDKVNAFSLPGGLVYITRGLYERRIGDDNDLLAAVIAHEMGHVVHKDSLKSSCRHAEESLRREVSADRAAARYMANAGYDPKCLEDLFKLIQDVQPPGWAQARIDALHVHH